MARLALAIATATALVSPANALAAAECPVSSVDFPTADARDRRLREEEALRVATQDLVLRLGEGITAPKPYKPPRPSSYGPGPGPAVQSASGMGAIRGDAPMANLSKEVLVKDGDKTVRMQVLPWATQEQAQEAYRRTREAEAKKSPLQRSIEAGDAAGVARVVAAGALRESRPVMTSDSWPMLAVNDWRMKVGQSGNDTKALKEVSRRHVAMLKSLLEGPGSDPDRDITTGLVGHIPIRTRGGERVPLSVETIQMLLERAPQVDPPVSSFAVESDHELVELMLRSGRASQRQKDGALLAAFNAFDWDTAAMLLEAGANPNQGTPDNTLLDRAFGPGWTQRRVVQAMIAQHVNPNIEIRGGFTPLMMAMHDQELMAGFLSLGADTRAKSHWEGLTALHFAVMWPNLRDAMPGGFPNRRLSNAALRLKSTELLLANGADANPTDPQGRTPLMFARDPEVVARLLDAGGVVRPTGNLGPIGWALSAGNEALAIGLAKRDPQVAKSDCTGVFYAAATGSTDTLDILLAQGASAQLHAADGTGDTPFIIAARQGHSKTVAMLLDRNAAKVDERATPLLYPVDSLTLGGYLPLPVPAATVASLRKSTAYRSSDGQTALMAAAQSGHVDTVKLLLARGANAGATDYSGRTALDYASRSPDVAAVLKERGAQPWRH